MKVIISSGFGKLHFHETVRAAAIGGAEVDFVTGWIPSRRLSRMVDALGRRLGEASLSSRMQTRLVDHPRVTMRSNALADFAGNAIMRGLKHALPSGELAGIAFAITGAATCRWLHDADIFHVRSGAGQGGAIRTARRNGLRVITDHSIAHPAYMDDVLSQEFARLGIQFQRASSNGLWSRVLRDCRECDRLLVNSDFVKRTFVERGFPADIIDVAYLGVRERYFSLKKNYAIEGPVRVLVTGSFNIRKGVATLLDAIRMLRKGGLDVRLRVIGNITDGKACLRESDFEFLTHTPFVPPEQLLPALAEADLFVFPTLIEGSSRSAMEAAAAGLPVITTENCGLPLDPEKEVVYIPLADPEALANAINRVAGDEGLRTRLGQSAARRIQRDYTWDCYGQQLLTIYGRLVGDESGSHGRRVDEMKKNGQVGRIVAETPPDANCFIGFHDIIPWSADESCVAIHRLDPSYCEMRDCDKPADICLWRPAAAGLMEKIDSTRAWNFQQGARLQWLPGRTDTVAFNTIDDGRVVSVFHNIVTGERRVLPGAIYALSPDGKVSIAPNFTTLAHRWKAYGYTPLIASPQIRDPAKDGLLLLDLQTGQERLFISTKRVAEHMPGPTSAQDLSKQFLCHPSFSPDGSRIAFLHRYFTSDGGSFTRMFVTEREARSLVMLAQEKVSHFDWIDNRTVVVWARFSGGLAHLRSSGLLQAPWLAGPLRLARSVAGRWKKKMLSESYYRLSVENPDDRVRFGWPSLEQDGHPMVARTHGWIVTDRYSDKNGSLPLILYNPEHDECINVEVFHHHPRSSDSDVKCDLHPRWSRSERLVAVDTCEAGYRQVRIVNVADIVATKREGTSVGSGGEAQ